MGIVSKDSPANGNLNSPVGLRESRLLLPGSLEHLPQDVGQNPAMAVVSDFFRCIGPGYDLKSFFFALIVARMHAKLRSRRRG